MYPSEAVPLIIFGRQRAGTRFLTDVLNSFEEVTLQGEVPNEVMKLVERFVRDVDKYYRSKTAAADESRRERRYRLWADKRRDLLFSLWTHVGQGRRVKLGPGCRYFGYKRPNNEFYFDFYEEFLQGHEPVYVYCVRNFRENFLSITSRWPNRSIDTVAKDYLASLRHYHRIRAMAPDRVFLFNLDEHIRVGLDYVERAVIAPLGLTVDDALRERLAAIGPRNTTEGSAKVPRRRILTPSEEKYLARRPELQAEFEILCEPADIGSSGETT